MVANGNRNANGHRNLSSRENGLLDGQWNPWDSLRSAQRIATFWQFSPPTCDGSPPNVNIENWVHEIKAILEASQFRASSWISLAVIQLRR